MRKIILFAVLAAGFLFISPEIGLAQCIEGDFPPDSFFQCKNGQICQGSECLSYSQVPETYVPDNVLDTIEDEIWYQRQAELWRKTNGQEGCHLYNTCITGENVSCTSSGAKCTGGCEGLSCGQAGQQLDISEIDKLRPWARYGIEECKINVSRGFIWSYRYHITGFLYSTADKCTNIDTSNQCLIGIDKNKGLWAGSCFGGAGGFYKCCCDNKTLAPVSSVESSDAATSDNYPPLEGVCPAGSHREWKQGDVINPNDCPQICNPNLTTKPPISITPPPPPASYCYHPDPATCKYGTLAELGIDPNLVTTFEQTGTLLSDISKTECTDLCKAKINPPGTPISYYYCSTPEYSCHPTAKTFPDRASCEASLDKSTTTGACYELQGDCEKNCSSGKLTTYYWCKSGSSCSSGKYPSKSACETANKQTCYTDFSNCLSACGIPSGKCDLKAVSSGNDISVSLKADPQCVPLKSTSDTSTLSWNINVKNSCPEGTTPTNSSFSCESCNIPAPGTSSGNITVTPATTTEYGIVCTRTSYSCCWKEDQQYACNCVGEGAKQVCDVCTRQITACDAGHDSSTKSAFQTVRVIGQPVIQSFTATPKDILYTAAERTAGYRKYSTLEWNSLAPDLGSPSKNLCSIKGDDGTSVINLNPLSFQKFAPSKTTVYTIQCRNSDMISPSTCYSDSTTEDVKVQVFGAGIEEQRPQSPQGSQSYFEDLGRKLGEIIRAFATSK
ncbi:MAG: hypothetical protein M1586_01175 [Patescibacteria group bacterium]|nr:hypothetical protein [Patescibacteria group bacterium]MCL5261898.1 hypothetical protein [Patescibacteria group bacterium]